MPDLITPRLTIVTFTLELVQAALHDRAALARLLGAAVPDDWPIADLAEILPFKARELAQDPEAAVWSGLIVHTQDRVLIGDLGCKSGPDPSGAVEIGYSIVPEYRGHGYAPEAVKALIGWAFAQPGVERVVAECFADNQASIRVLEKSGLRRLEPEGILLYWEIASAPS